MSDEDQWAGHRRDHELLATAVRDAAGARASDDDYLTRREAEVLLDAGRTAAASAFEAHEKVHAAERAAIDAALVVAARDRQTHEEAHGREHVLHSEKHTSEDSAVSTALAAVARERTIHADAHEREHVAHQREHALNNLAIEKAERSTDIRFQSANGYRETTTDAFRQMTTKEAFETFQKDANRRFEDMRTSIVNLEKGDASDKGRGVGQGATIAYIVTAITVVGSVLGTIIILANVLTTS